MITSFSDSFHDNKNKKNLYMGGFNYFAFNVRMGPNYYINDLEEAFFKANST